MVETNKNTNGIEFGSSSITLETFLSRPLLVNQVHTMDDLRTKITQKRPLRIMMGQTFDEGNPVDMLKYAFSIMGISDLLRQQGIDTSASWLIADHFITDINKDEEAVRTRELVLKRVGFLKRLNLAFNGDIDFTLSSELSRSSEYLAKLNSLTKKTEEDSNFKDKMLEAIPEDRRDNPEAIRYPLEELATIQAMGTDIKVGPLYERNYDLPARKAADESGTDKYVAIHLTKGYLFGSAPYLDTPIRKDVEEYGILPYKINSKGLQRLRIDVFGQLDDARKLILETDDTRAIADLLMIAALGKERLSGNFESALKVGPYTENDLLEFVANGDNKLSNSDINFLKKVAVWAYQRYIYVPLNKL